MSITTATADKKESKKSCHITIRLTPEELEEVREYAQRLAMSQSEFGLAAIRSGMNKNGLEEKYLALAKRVDSLEQITQEQSRAA